MTIQPRIVSRIASLASLQILLYSGLHRKTHGLIAICISSAIFVSSTLHHNVCGLSSFLLLAICHEVGFNACTLGTSKSWQACPLYALFGACQNCLLQSAVASPSGMILTHLQRLYILGTAHPSRHPASKLKLAEIFVVSTTTLWLLQQE